LSESKNTIKLKVSEFEALVVHNQNERDKSTANLENEKRHSEKLLSELNEDLASNKMMFSN
jgi:hypothetical protein